MLQKEGGSLRNGGRRGGPRPGGNCRFCEIENVCHNSGFNSFLVLKIYVASICKFIWWIVTDLSFFSGSSKQSIYMHFERFFHGYYLFNCLTLCCGTSILMDCIQIGKRWKTSLLFYIDLSSYNAQLLIMHWISGKPYDKEF